MNIDFIETTGVALSKSEQQKIRKLSEYFARLEDKKSYSLEETFLEAKRHLRGAEQVNPEMQWRVDWDLQDFLISGVIPTYVLDTYSSLEKKKLVAAG